MSRLLKNQRLLKQPSPSPVGVDVKLVVPKHWALVQIVRSAWTRRQVLANTAGLHCLDLPSGQSLSINVSAMKDLTVAQASGNQGCHSIRNGLLAARSVGQPKIRARLPHMRKTMRKHSLRGKRRTRKRKLLCRCTNSYENTCMCFCFILTRVISFPRMCHAFNAVEPAGPVLCILCQPRCFSVLIAWVISSI